MSNIEQQSNNQCSITTAAFHSETRRVHVQTGDNRFSLRLMFSPGKVPNVTTCPGTFSTIFNTFTVRLLCVL